MAAHTFITVPDDLDGSPLPAIEECPGCHAGPFAGETEEAAVANLNAHMDRWGCDDEDPFLAGGEVPR